MPNTTNFSATTPNAKVMGTVTDCFPALPTQPPMGLTAVGPRVTFNFIKDEWSSNNSYSYYDVVQIKGQSYIAKQSVPTGIDISNTDYWIKWNDPNAQFAELQETVQTFDTRITQNTNDIANKAPKVHNSTNSNEYGIGNNTMFGHVALTDTVSDDTAAKDGIAVTAHAVKTQIDSITTNINSKAPINHASNNTTYGIGTDSNYGHLKLSDTITNANASSGTALTPNAVVSMQNNVNNNAHLFSNVNGWLQHKITAKENVTLSSLEQYKIFASCKGLNLINVNLRLTATNSIAQGTALVNVVSTNIRYESVVLAGCSVFVFKDKDFIATTSAALKQNGDISIGRSLTANEIVIITGMMCSNTLQDPIMNAYLYSNSIADNIIKSFLTGDDKWTEGSLTYSTENSVRLDPESTRKTDCSGLTYYAFNKNGLIFDGSVQAAYLGGTHIAYADADTPLDLSMAHKGDIIIFQNPDLIDGTYNSFTHCALYLGNNKLAEMAKYYPNNMHATDTGPYTINNANTYRMNTTDDNNTKRNRYVVRFI